MGAAFSNVGSALSKVTSAIAEKKQITSGRHGLNKYESLTA